LAGAGFHVKLNMTMNKSLLILLASLVVLLTAVFYVRINLTSIREWNSPPPMSCEKSGVFRDADLGIEFSVGDGLAACILGTPALPRPEEWSIIVRLDVPVASWADLDQSAVGNVRFGGKFDLSKYDIVSSTVEPISGVEREVWVVKPKGCESCPASRVIALDRVGRTIILSEHDASVGLINSFRFLDE
jgi:hypothetical protein